MKLSDLTEKQGVLVENTKQIEDIQKMLVDTNVKFDPQMFDHVIKVNQQTEMQFIFSPKLGVFIPAFIFLISKGEVIRLEQITNGEEQKTKPEEKTNEVRITRKDLIMIHRETNNNELKDWIMSDICECGMHLDDEESEITPEDIAEYDEHFTSPEDRGLLMKYNFGITLVREEPKQEEKDVPEILVILMSI